MDCYEKKFFCVYFPFNFVDKFYLKNDTGQILLLACLPYLTLRSLSKQDFSKCSEYKKLSLASHLKHTDLECVYCSHLLSKVDEKFEID